MDLNQYLEDDMPPFEDIATLEKRKSSGDAAAVESDNNNNGSGGGFDCNICLECVQEPVVTLCGHLYCWPCIYKWLHFQSNSSEDDQEKPRLQCPVCKSEVSQSTLVPLYGRGQASEFKARQAGIAVPRRPPGPRSHDLTPISQSASRSYHRPQQFDSARSGYTSPMLSTPDSTFGVFGEMMYARVFGNHMSYTYPNSHNLPGNYGNARTARRIMEADKSLGRICFFLLCCVLVCLLLF